MSSQLSENAAVDAADAGNGPPAAASLTGDMITRKSLSKSPRAIDSKKPAVSRKRPLKTVDAEPPANDARAREAMAREALAKEALAEEALAQEAAAKAAAAKAVAAEEAAAKEAAAKEAAAKVAAAEEAAAKAAAAKESLAKEALALEVLAKEVRAKEALANAALARDAKAKESAPKDAKLGAEAPASMATPEAIAAAAGPRGAMAWLNAHSTVVFVYGFVFSFVGGSLFVLAALLFGMI